MMAPLLLSRLGLIALLSAPGITAPIIPPADLTERVASLCDDPGISWDQKGNAGCPICADLTEIQTDLIQTYCIPKDPSVFHTPTEDVWRRDPDVVDAATGQYVSDIVEPVLIAVRGELPTIIPVQTGTHDENLAAELDGFIGADYRHSVLAQQLEAKAAVYKRQGLLNEERGEQDLPDELRRIDGAVQGPKKVAPSTSDITTILNAHTSITTRIEAPKVISETPLGSILDHNRPHPGPLAVEITKRLSDRHEDNEDDISRELFAKDYVPRKLPKAICSSETVENIPRACIGPGPIDDKTTVALLHHHSKLLQISKSTETKKSPIGPKQTWATIDDVVVHQPAQSVYFTDQDTKPSHDVPQRAILPRKIIPESYPVIHEPAHDLWRRENEHTNDEKIEASNREYSDGTYAKPDSRKTMRQKDLGKESLRSDRTPNDSLQGNGEFRKPTLEILYTASDLYRRSFNQKPGPQPDAHIPFRNANPKSKSETEELFDQSASAPGRTIIDSKKEVMYPAPDVYRRFARQLPSTQGGNKRTLENSQERKKAKVDNIKPESGDGDLESRKDAFTHHTVSEVYRRSLGMEPLTKELTEEGGIVWENSGRKEHSLEQRHESDGLEPTIYTKKQFFRLEERDTRSLIPLRFDNDRPWPFLPRRLLQESGSHIPFLVDGTENGIANVREDGDRDATSDGSIVDAPISWPIKVDNGYLDGTAPPLRKAANKKDKRLADFDQDPMVGRTGESALQIHSANNMWRRNKYADVLENILATEHESNNTCASFKHRMHLPAGSVNKCQEEVLSPHNETSPEIAQYAIALADMRAALQKFLELCNNTTVLTHLETNSGEECQSKVRKALKHVHRGKVEVSTKHNLNNVKPSQIFGSVHESNEIITDAVDGEFSSDHDMSASDNVAAENPQSSKVRTRDSASIDPRAVREEKEVVRKDGKEDRAALRAWKKYQDKCGGLLAFACEPKCSPSDPWPCIPQPAIILQPSIAVQRRSSKGASALHRQDESKFEHDIMNSNSVTTDKPQKDSEISKKLRRNGADRTDPLVTIPFPVAIVLVPAETVRKQGPRDGALSTKRSEQFAAKSEPRPLTMVDGRSQDKGNDVKSGYFQKLFDTLVPAMGLVPTSVVHKREDSVYLETDLNDKFYEQNAQYCQEAQTTQEQELCYGRSSDGISKIDRRYTHANSLSANAIGPGTPTPDTQAEDEKGWLHDHLIGEQREVKQVDAASKYPRSLPEDSSGISSHSYGAHLPAPMVFRFFKRDSVRNTPLSLVIKDSEKNDITSKTQQHHDFASSHQLIEHRPTYGSDLGDGSTHQPERLTWDAPILKRSAFGLERADSVFLDMSKEDTVEPNKALDKEQTEEVDKIEEKRGQIESEQEKEDHGAKRRKKGKQEHSQLLKNRQEISTVHVSVDPIHDKYTLGLKKRLHVNLNPFTAIAMYPSSEVNGVNSKPTYKRRGTPDATTKDSHDATGHDEHQGVGVLPNPHTPWAMYPSPEVGDWDRKPTRRSQSEPVTVPAPDDLYQKGDNQEPPLRHEVAGVTPETQAPNEMQQSNYRYMQLAPAPRVGDWGEKPTWKRLVMDDSSQSNAGSSRYHQLRSAQGVANLGPKSAAGDSLVWERDSENTYIGLPTGGEDAGRRMRRGQRGSWSQVCGGIGQGCPDPTLEMQ